MDLKTIKKDIDLLEFARERYAYKCDGQGRGSCLFHPPDNNNSFSIFKGNDGVWRWKDFHDGEGGTIIDLVSRMENIDEKEACRRLLEEFGGEPRKEKLKLEVEREHIYVDAESQPIFKKVKYKPNPRKISFGFLHYENGRWESGKGGHELIPYNLNGFKNHKAVIITEGEKDSDTINSLDIGLFATSAPTGKSSWPDVITKYFSHFNEVTFLYDVGNDADVMKHVVKLRAAFPSLKIYIARVPSDIREFDITDYLNTQADKSMALLDIMDKSEDVSIEKDEAALTAEELAALQIPEIDWLVKPIIERFGFCLVGAQKGVGKSLFVTQLGLYVAAGSSPFLIDEIKIPKALNVLLIQQEVSLPGMKDRLFKMRGEKVFDLGGRFRQKTTTGNWWNLTNKDDYMKLIRLVEKYKPDILILDPLYTFYPRELNTSGDISPMMKILSDLKSNFGLGLIVVHHFSNKQDSDEIEFRSSVGRFMGHSMIANSADSTIGLDFLHAKYRQQTLPLPYQNYIVTEITTRHGAWPARFCLERKRDALLFEKSSIWQDLGRCLVPGQIEDVLEANDGQMLQKDVIEILAKDARRTTVRRAIDEAFKSGKVTKETLPGKGHPVLLRLVK